MCTKCIVVLVGVPGAGKTTFHKTLVQRYADHSTLKFYTLMYDDLIDKDRNTDYKYKRAKAFATAKDLLTSIPKVSTNKRHVVIIDDNMQLKSMRFKFYKLAKELELSFLEVYFDVKLEIALLRNSNRENKIPEETVIKMAKQIEKPKKSWEQNVFIVNSNFHFDDDLYGEFFKKLESSFHVPLRKRVSLYSAKIPATKWHVIDLILRKIVHLKIVGDKDSSIKFSHQKQEIFKAVKEGRVVIEDYWDEAQIFDNLLIHFK